MEGKGRREVVYKVGGVRRECKRREVKKESIMRIDRLVKREKKKTNKHENIRSSNNVMKVAQA